VPIAGASHFRIGQVPLDALDGAALAAETSAYVNRRVHAAIPGAIPAIRTMRHQGYTLHAASGEFAVDLEGYLTGMGVLACFDTLFGCDIIGMSKSGPGYYERVFQHAGVEPAQTQVVDDNEHVLDWAAALGVRTVLCGPAAPTANRHGHVTMLAALPAWLRELAPMSGAQ
jgi:HAD superfamily hydrolase (TIGR01509 family)